MSNRTYYRGPDAVVTDRLFVWHTTQTKGFVVRDLRNVGLVRGNITGNRPSALPVAGGALVVLVTAWATLEPQVAVVTSLVAAVALLIVATAGHRMRPRRWEMRASYRGREVIVYASSDVRVFNQVARALRRSVEDCRPVATKADLAAA
jgi:uncharacterized membrane protein